jgi:hypothetical protein
MEVIDIQTKFIEQLQEQAVMTIIKKDDGGYKVTVKVGDESKTCEWGMLSLCYDWAVGYMMMHYGFIDF